MTASNVLDARGELIRKVLTVALRSLAPDRIIRAALDASDPLGVDFKNFDRFIAELLTRVSNGVVLAGCVQLATTLPILSRLSRRSDYARDVYEKAVAGNVYVALAATEGGQTGSSLVHGRTLYSNVGNGKAVLHGSKTWITGALECDYFLVLAKYKPSPHFTSFSWLLLPRSAPGVDARAAAIDFLPEAGIGEVTFSSVALDRRNHVGGNGRALADLTRQLTAERLAGALWARRACRIALLAVHERLVHRSAGVGNLWDISAIRERFARCLVHLMDLDRICELGFQRTPTILEGLAIKATYSASAKAILDECVELCGADSFATGGFAELRKELSIFSIAGGATASLLSLISDNTAELLEIPGE